MIVVHKPSRLPTLLGLTLLVLCARAEALIINPTFVNDAGQTWTTDRQRVITQAISDWTASIADNQTVNVTFTFATEGTGSYLGQWSAMRVSTRNALPWTAGLDHTITFNTSYFTGTNYLWWDPTPTAGNDQPFAAWDALSVTRHELGHMLGFTDGLYYDNYQDRWATNISGTTFDAGGLNVPMASLTNLGHVANSGIAAGDLMTPSLVNGTRRAISELDLQMLAVAYGYGVLYHPVPLPGDFNGDGTVTHGDYTIWADSFGFDGLPGQDMRADGNGDGHITHADYTLWADYFGQSLPITVPEPASLAMLGLGFLTLLRRRR